MMPRVRQEHVEESRPGDLHPLDSIAQATGQLIAQPLADVARLVAEHWRQQERGVGRVVAEAGALGTLERRVDRAAAGRLGQRRGGRLELGAQLAERA